MNRTHIDIALLAPQPLDHATSLQARYYVDPAMVALDRRAIFDRGWQMLAHVCQLQNPGDHVVGDFAGLPVIAVRGADGEIRVFHNVCRHRAGPLASATAWRRSRCAAATTAGPTRWTARCARRRKWAPPRTSTSATSSCRNWPCACGRAWCSPPSTKPTRRLRRLRLRASTSAWAPIAISNATATTGAWVTTSTATGRSTSTTTSRATTSRTCTRA